MRMISLTGDYKVERILGMKLRIFRKKTDYVVMAGLLLLFGYFTCFGEMKELSDSFQYLNQFVTRDPIYALLLKFFTAVFGENYLFPLCLFQNILAVIAIYWIYLRVTDLFKFPVLFEMGVAVLFVMPHIITPLASQSRMIITNSVLTEGIAFSLYYIWAGMLLTLLLQRYGQHQNKGIILSGLLSVVLAMIRGQFLLCMAVWLLISVFVLGIQKNYKTILIVFLGFVLAFVGKSYFTKTYNYLESGIFVNTVASKPMMLANAVYLSDVEDGSTIENEDLRHAYENIVRLVDERQLSIKYATGNMISKAQFHEYGHETINFEIIDPEIEAVIEKRDGITSQQYMHLMVKMDEYAGEMFGDILPNILSEFIQNYLVIASLGFVRSIAVDRSILPIYALGMYLLAMILTVVLLKKNKCSNGAYFMLLSLLLICGTVFGTSIAIECISRYMIYNFPFFYIAGMAMLTELWENRKGLRDNGI